MRNNGTSTQNEIKMKRDEVLVSRTDLKGHIVYANRAFCDIAGFTNDELKGEPHNIVRHPDMPSAAFEDLWETLQAEKPWTGMVKNRCKNGAYYWVIANVSPEYDSSGKVSGYVSVRTAPTQSQITTVEALYRDVNAGKAKLPSTIACSWFKSLQLKTVMVAASIVSLATLFVLGGLFLSSLQQQKHDTELRIAALPFITSVRSVLEFVPQHRGMGNAYLNGKKELAGRLAENERKVDALLNVLADTAESAPFPALINDVSSVRNQWLRVKSRWKKQSVKESFRSHSAVIESLLKLSSDVLHAGQLTSDPALDVAHLAEFMSETIPTMNEHLGRLRGLGSGIAAKGTITATERDMLLELYVLARLESDGFLAEVEHVMRVYNTELTVLKPELQQLSTAITQYLNIIKHEMLDSTVIAVDSAAYFSAGSEAITASLSLYDAMGHSLKALLEVQRAEVIQMYYITIGAVAFGVIGSLLLSLLMMQKTFGPLKEIVDGMQRIVEGDYHTVPVKHAFDELGEIADDMKTMQSMLQYEVFEGKNMALEREKEQRQSAIEKSRAEATLADAFEENVGSLIVALAAEVNQVNASSVEMDAVSDVLAEQSASAMHGVELGSSHVNSTAAAIEEMSVTISDVSRQVSDTQIVSAQAVVEAEAATMMMSELTRVAEQIGSIVGTISEIAEQTNLLALNASIEAARAGDAGRGFSVVAGEVKELANQTSQATTLIREQVAGIQNESEKATEAISKISKTIGEINSFTSRVAEAMEQQAEAGHEISNAAQQADISMGDARTAVGELEHSAVSVDKSSDEIISIASSMAQRTEDVQNGIDSFVATLRKGG